MDENRRLAHLELFTMILCGHNFLVSSRRTLNAKFEIRMSSNNDVNNV